MSGRANWRRSPDICKENGIDVVIFDDELSPSQTRNIEKEMPCRLLDRTRLILDIFMSRAQTAYAKTQVQLANYEYLLPRLSGMWTHLERQRGGTGTRGGAGEREIETDRRIIRNRIAKLKEDLKKIDRQMAVQRSNRRAMVRVALVGYTNVGKSTLMNLISKSEVFAENKLFATLDTTVREVVFDNLPFLLSEYRRVCPKTSHRADRVVQIDVGRGPRSRYCPVHVVDISHPQFEEQIDVVKQTLQEIGAGDKPVYLVFNKVDAYTYVEKDEDDLSASDAREPFAGRVEAELDRTGQHALHLPFGADEGQPRKIPFGPLRHGARDPCRALSVQQFPLLTTKSTPDL